MDLDWNAGRFVFRPTFWSLRVFCFVSKEYDGRVSSSDEGIMIPK